MFENWHKNFRQTKIWRQSAKIAVGKVSSNEIRTSHQGRVLWLDGSGYTDRVPIYLCETPLCQPGWKCQKSMHAVAALCVEKPHH